MINKQFPSAYDVEQTIRFRSTQYEDVRRFYQTQGLLNIGNGKDHLAYLATNLLLEHRDYNALRQIAQGAHDATNISGFSISTKLMPKTGQDILNDLITLRGKLAAQGEELKKKGAPHPILEMPQLQDGSLSATFKYQRTILGRVELIQQVDTDVKFVIEPVKEQFWRVICYPEANQDIKKIESLFKTLDSGSYEPFIISLEEFSQKQRIQFFDDLLDYYSQEGEWKFVEVTEIAMRQGKEEKYLLLEPEELENPEEVEGAEETDLLSITQAVLQGQRLRTNSFVKKCENQGFYFPAMTLSLKNRKSSELIEVTIRFKLSPKLFEVVLATMAERTPMGDTPTSFTYTRQQEILREFWITCHRLWESIYQQLPQLRKERQLSLAEMNNADRD